MTHGPNPLPGGMNPEEVAAIRRLQKELEGAGYDVREVALTGGGHPVAVVARREDGKTPIRTLVAAARSLLRAAEAVEEGEAVSPEEAETLAAARLTLRVARGRLAVRRMKTIGGAAHRQMADAVERGEEDLDEG
jgi:hypothetical protein